HAAEGDHGLAVLDDLLPGHVAPADALERPRDMREQHGGGSCAVAVDGAHVAAERRVEEPVQLALRVMETPGARPAVRATEDRAGSMCVAYPLELVCQQVEHAVPGHRDELIPAAPVVGTGSALEPAAPDHGKGDPRPMPDRLRKILQNGI